MFLLKKKQNIQRKGKKNWNHLILWTVFSILIEESHKIKFYYTITLMVSIYFEREKFNLKEMTG